MKLFVWKLQEILYVLVSLYVSKSICMTFVSAQPYNIQNFRIIDMYVLIELSKLLE